MTTSKEPSPLLSQPEEVALLRDIAQSLNEANNVSEAMSAILPALSRVLGLKTAWAFRFDPQRATFVEAGASGLPPALSHHNAEALKSSWCECQDRLMNGKLDRAINIVRCSRLRDAVGDKEGLNFHASIPLKMHDRPLGILNVAAEGTTVFTQAALDLLRAIGYHVAVTMDRAALLSDMRRRNQQLEALGSIARALTGTTDRTQLIKRATELFGGLMGYDAVALYQEDQLLYQWQNPAGAEPEYSYRDQTTSLLPVEERRLLEDACSRLEVPVPRYPLKVRVESSSTGAFGPIDEDISRAFAWYLTAFLEQIDLYHQAMDTARWTERRQLAADLHDSVSQHLFSAQLLAKSLSDQAGSGDDHVVNLAERLQAVIRASQNEMRRLIEALRPESIPLAVALRHRLIGLRDVVGSRLTWQLDAPDLVLTTRVQDGVIRIADEALQNALKHSADAPIQVLLKTDKRYPLVLEVRDQGPGFLPDAVRAGYGLQTMQERARHMGARLTLSTRPGRGTRVILRIPKEVIGE